MRIIWNILWICLLTAPLTCGARTLAVDLWNGDRVTGVVLAESTNTLVLSNAWSQAIEIPMAQIYSKTELKEAYIATVEPPVAVPITVQEKPAAPSKTDKLKKLWKADIQLGMDVAYGIRDVQTYYGRARAERTFPYGENSPESSRLKFDYSAEYGRTDASLSANRMDGSISGEFDIGRRFFINDELRVGYNEIRLIDLYYELGPGLGYHLLRKTNINLNVSAGADYQVEYEQNDGVTREFYYRLAQELKWNINSKLTFEESFEFFPGINDFNEYRARLEAMLRYKLFSNLTLNLTLQDYYDTTPPRDVGRNELKIRSSLGVTF